MIIISFWVWRKIKLPLQLNTLNNMLIWGDGAKRPLRIPCFSLYSWRSIIRWKYSTGHFPKFELKLLVVFEDNEMQNHIWNKTQYSIFIQDLDNLDMSHSYLPLSVVISNLCGILVNNFCLTLKCWCNIEYTLVLLMPEVVPILR